MTDVGVTEPTLETVFINLTGRELPRMTATTIETTTGTRTAGAAFSSLLLRDLVVVRKQPVPFLMRTVTQPLLTVFVFAYVFPKIGQQIGGHNSDFATDLAPGLLGMSMIFQGIQAVALPLVQEFGYTRARSKTA